MKAIAIKDNKTLGIYKDEEYDIHPFMALPYLVTTINEHRDEIVITSSHFKKEA